MFWNNWNNWNDWNDWLTNDWMYAVWPLLVCIEMVLLGWLARRIISKVLRKRLQKAVLIQNLIIDSIWHPFLYWFLLLGIYIAIKISILAPNIKLLVGKGVATLFVVSLMWVAISLTTKLIRFYLVRVKAIQSLTSLSLNLLRATISLVGILTILDIWGLPTEIIVIFLVASLLIVALVLRNSIDNLLAWFDIVHGEHIKVGHIIKLSSGEKGYVTQISWSRTTIRTDEGNSVIIPNKNLMADNIINYGLSSDETAVNDVQRDVAAVKPRKLVEILSAREQEVLALIGIGATNNEIAAKLIISQHTVKSHIRSILSKLHFRNRQQAAAFAEREGLMVGIDSLVMNS